MTPYEREALIAAYGWRSGEPPTEPLPLTEAERVLVWRTERLEALGLVPYLAAYCAGDSGDGPARVDHHELGRLVRAGCAVSVALDILR